MAMRIFIIYHLIILFFYRSNASNCVAIADGDWNNPGTWSCGHAPSSNDVIYINSGVTVTLDIVTTTLSSIVVQIYGTLYLQNGKKLNLSSDGIINVYEGGQIQAGNPGSKIVIGGNTVFTGSGSKPGPFSFTASGEGVLPVKISSFEANVTKNAKIEIKWTTESELNNDFFSIEKSSNGLDYKSLGVVKGHGTTYKKIEYSFIDISPNNGSSYYRLKQNDIDGKHEYFGPVAINFELKENGGCVMKVYPNPCFGKCNVVIEGCDDSDKDYIEVEMLDASGVKVHSHIPIREQNGNFNFEIDSHSYLKPGIYIVRGINKNENYNKKLIVK